MVEFEVQYRPETHTMEVRATAPINGKKVTLLIATSEEAFNTSLASLLNILSSRMDLQVGPACTIGHQVVVEYPTFPAVAVDKDEPLDTVF